MADLIADRARFDWRGLEDAATAQLVTAVRGVRAEHPQTRVYGAMFHAFYADGTVICWPFVSVGTEETLAAVLAEYEEQRGPEEGLENALRWSGADLPHLSEPVPCWSGRATWARDSSRSPRTRPAT